MNLGVAPPVRTSVRVLRREPVTESSRFTRPSKRSCRACSFSARKRRSATSRPTMVSLPTLHCRPIPCGGGRAKDAVLETGRIVADDPLNLPGRWVNQFFLCARFRSGR